MQCFRMSSGLIPRNRKHVIISEILFHLPDILLLQVCAHCAQSRFSRQEVQVASSASLNHLDFFDASLTKRGYHGICLSSFAFLTPLPKPGNLSAVCRNNFRTTDCSHIQESAFIGRATVIKKSNPRKSSSLTSSLSSQKTFRIAM